MTIRSAIELAAQQAPGGIKVDWGLGNPARKPPEKARKVRTQIADEYGGNFYAMGRGLPETRKAMVKFSAEIDGVHLDPEQNILISECGSCWLLELLIKEQLKRNPGKTQQVFIPLPYYGRHYEATQLPNVECCKVPYGSGASYIDRLVEGLEEGEGGIVVISSVDNPMTTVLSEQDMLRAARAAKQRGAILFVDDAYRHVYRESPIPSIFKVAPWALQDDVVATFSLSKGHQWPGLKGAALLGNSRIVDMVFEAKSRISEGGDPSSQAAMEAALYDYQFLEDTREEYRRLQTQIILGLNWAGWEEAYGSSASIFLRLPLPERVKMSSMDFSLQLAHRGIVVFCAEMFGELGWVRLCMKETDEANAEAFERIKQFLLSF